MTPARDGLMVKGEIDMIVTRRAFLKDAACGSAAGITSKRSLAAPAAEGWDRLPEILARIQPPRFPDRDFDITQFGAFPGGERDSDDAISRAIDACAAIGGGRVIVPAGVFLTGPVRLKSNVNLHVSPGATLRFSRDPRRYLPLVYTRFEGVECMNYSPFIYSYGQDNIAISGTGTLDGQCDCEHWWPWKGRADCGWTKGQPTQDAARKALLEMGAKDVPVSERRFGEGRYLRPPFIQPVRGKNILIEGVTIVNSPMYEINPLMCSNLTVRNVKIASHGPNNDGCDPDSSRDVLIENCEFDTGDDCIAIKSGRNRDGRRIGMPSENIVIRNCRMKDGHGGITIGSEMSGGVHNVFAEKCLLDSPNLNQAFRFKTNAMRGGTIEDIFIRDMTLGQISDAVLQVDFYYEEGLDGPERPVVRNVEIRDVSCKKSTYAVYARGFPNAPIRGIRLEHCNFENVAKDNVVENVEGLLLRNVKINGKNAGP